MTSLSRIRLEAPAEAQATIFENKLLPLRVQADIADISADVLPMPDPNHLGVRGNYNSRLGDYPATLQTNTSNFSASEYADYGDKSRKEHQRGSSDPAFERDIELPDRNDYFAPSDRAVTERAPGYDEAFEELGKPVARLKMQLNRAMLAQSQTASRFLPRSELERICQRDGIYKELEQLQNPLYAYTRRSPAEMAECAAWICEGRDNERSSREIFAILSCIDQGDLIWDFKSEGLRDFMLPFSRDAEQTNLWRKRKGDHEGMDPKQAITFLSGNEDMFIVRGDFYDKQWSVHTPYIGSRKNGEAQHYDLEVGTIMPWLNVGPGNPHGNPQGGFGYVQMVQIHESHHSFKPPVWPPDMKFALKTLIDGTEDPRQVLISFRNECLALRSIKQYSHVVELCATFNLGGKCMMLFPWAGGGSLNDLWDVSEGKSGKYPSELCQTSQQSPSISRAGKIGRADSIALIHWIARQCLGISTALAEMHHCPQPRIPSRGDKCCRHGDIKPHNILYFTEEQDESPLGTLKLSDFGLAELHGIHSRTNPPGPGPLTQAYRAPEYDLPDEVEISLQADVWSLGCVFTELLTWVVKGPVGVEDYGDERAKELTFPPTATKSIGADDFFCRPEMSGARSGPRGGEKYATYKDLKRKTSVDKWCEEVVKQGTTAHGPTFLGDFMNFTTTEMMHPWRANRASSQDVADFLNKCISDWPIDEPGSYWDCNVASKDH